MQRTRRGVRTAVASSAATALVAVGLAQIPPVGAASVWAETTERVSVSSEGVEGNANSGSAKDRGDSAIGYCEMPRRGKISLTEPGDAVAFISDASNFVRGDTNQYEWSWGGVGVWGTDAFLHDRATAVTSRESMTAADTEEGNLPSCEVDVDATGDALVFATYAQNIGQDDPGDEPDPDVLLRDPVANTTELINPDGTRAEAPQISGDGRWVAYMTYSKIDWDDTNGTTDVYAHDRVGQATVWISRGTGGVPGDGDVSDFAMAGSARYVAFTSAATNLTATPEAGGHDEDVFVRDSLAGTTRLISADSLGAPVGGSQVGISETGRYVVFRSCSDALDGAFANARCDIFRKDRAYGTMRRVSVPSGGGAANGHSAEPSISDDGSLVVFESSASNLVAGDTNGATDVFLRDLDAGTTARLSVSEVGDQANGPSEVPVISGDGTTVAFTTRASNLVPGDTNGAWDVIVRDLDSGAFADAPSAPTALSATAQFESFEVSWSPPATDGGRPVAGYTVTVEPGGIEQWVDAGTTTLFVPDLTNGVHYDVEVVATTSIGSSPPATIVVTPRTTPGAPTDVRAFAVDGGVEVWWQPPGFDGGAEITSYDAVAGAASSATSPVARYVRLEGLPNGVLVSPNVAATNEAGSGPTQNAPSVTPHACGDPLLFPDVLVGHPFCEDIGWLVAFDIAAGYGDGLFHPGVSVSRQALVAMLHRYAGSPGSNDPSCVAAPFTDVGISHQFCGEIAWAAAEELVGGFADGSFHPADSTSRQALVAMLYRSSGSPDGVDPSCVAAPFTDVGVTHAFCGEIAWAAEQGLVAGYVDGTFRPAVPVSRQATARILHGLSRSGW